MGLKLGSTALASRPSPGEHAVSAWHLRRVSFVPLALADVDLVSLDALVPGSDDQVSGRTTASRPACGGSGGRRGTRRESGAQHRERG